MKIVQVTVVAQDNDKGPSSRPSAMRIEKGAKNGIKKTILKLVNIEGCDGVHVRYQLPGRVWKKEIAMRISSLGRVVQDMWFFDQELVNKCMKGNKGGEITDDVARVMLAIMLHYACRTTADLQKLGVHENYWEQTFIQDLVNTKEFWLPATLGDGELKKMHAFYVLVCEEEEIRGLSRSDRQASLLTGIDNWPNDRIKMVKEIMELVERIDDELVGADEIGKKDAPMDPFDTESLIWKTEQVCKHGVFDGD